MFNDAGKYEVKDLNFPILWQRVVDHVRGAGVNRLPAAARRPHESEIEETEK